jgi:hypothetical protein
MIAVDRKAPKPLHRHAAIFVTALHDTAASNNENNRIVMSVRQASKTMRVLVMDLQMARLLRLVLKLTAIALSLRLPFHSSGR